MKQVNKFLTAIHAARIPDKVLDTSISLDLRTHAATIYVELKTSNLDLLFQHWKEFEREGFLSPSGAVRYETMMNPDTTGFDKPYNLSIVCL